MVQVVRIPMGSNPAPFFANFFLVHKEAEWVKAQRKLGTINVQKINNSCRFIDDLQSLNYDSTSEKNYKDICPTELELKRENNSNSCASFFGIYIYIENGEFPTKFFDNQDKFDFDIVIILFYCSSVSSIMFSDSIGPEFLTIPRAASKIEDLSSTSKQLLNIQTKWTNEENQSFFNKSDLRALRSFYHI